MPDDDLIERCVHAARTASGSFLRDPEVNRDEYWDYVVRAVLSQVDAAQPPAPIAAEDVRAAERAWLDGSRGDEAVRMNWAAFVADYLNRRLRRGGLSEATATSEIERLREALILISRSSGGECHGASRQSGHPVDCPDASPGDQWRWCAHCIASHSTGVVDR